MVDKMADTDEECIRALGEFGRWQFRGVLLVALVKVPAAWQMASILFTALNPGEFWCARPSEFLSLEEELWRQFIHPNTSSGRRDPCNRYDVEAEKIDWTQWAPVNTSVRPCEGFEFREGKITLVTEWSLVCEWELLVSVAQFFYLVGILVGGALCRLFLIRFSPRKVLITAMAMQIIAGTSVALAPQFEIQVFLRFLTALSSVTMFTTAYVICTDITAGRWRLITGACYEHLWSVGVVTLAGLGYICSNWRYLQLAISLPTSFLLLAYRWIPDSPRWLIVNGYREEAKFILEEGAAFNRRLILVTDIPVLPTQKKKTEVSWSELFSNANHRWNCLVLHILWAVTIVTYYGALLNVKNVGEHLYFNTAMAGIAEVVGVLLGLALILWCRHKWVALGTILLVGGGTGIFSCALRSHGKWHHEWEILGLAMTGRIAIAISLTLLQVTSSELLPLEHRELGTYSSLIFARIFLLSTPFIGPLAMYGDYVPFSVYGAITCMGGLAALYLGLAKSKTSQCGQ